jgi:type VI secretion system secreted protein Hcp
MRAQWIIAALTAGLLAIPLAARAAVEAYLKIDGVVGESQDDQHKDWIELSSFQMGSTQPANGPTATGGAAAGHASVGDIHVTKVVDASSPTLMQAAAHGTRYPSAEVDLMRNGQVYLVYHLTDVVISSVQTSAPADGHPTETVTLNYARIQTDYTPANTTTTTNTLVHAAPVTNAGAARAP